MLCKFLKSIHFIEDKFKNYDIKENIFEHNDNDIKKYCMDKRTGLSGVDMFHGTSLLHQDQETKVSLQYKQDFSIIRMLNIKSASLTKTWI